MSGLGTDFVDDEEDEQLEDMFEDTRDELPVIFRLMLYYRI